LSGALLVLPRRGDELTPEELDSIAEPEAQDHELRSYNQEIAR
jgi:hypothetical protein